MEAVFLTPGNSKFTRFNRISWGQGLLACGKENGEIELWNPSQIIQNNSQIKPNANLVPTFKAKNHSGQVRGLHFNPGIKTQFASGATEGDVIYYEFRYWFGTLMTLQSHMPQEHAHSSLMM